MILSCQNGPKSGSQRVHVDHLSREKGTKLIITMIKIKLVRPRTPPYPFIFFDEHKLYIWIFFFYTAGRSSSGPASLSA